MKTLISVALVTAFSATAPAGPAAAKTNIDVLHAFCTKTDCSDGSEPTGGLVADGNGNYYGTTAIGGDSNAGTIFRASKKAGKWTVSRIYSFCHIGECPDGATPQGNLIIDTAGNLYGIASDGGNNDGNNGAGLVYELSPNGNKWKYKVLYTFCSGEACVDGRDPHYAGLSYQGAATGAPYDGTSPLYGTTQFGGGANDAGVVFELTPKGKNWTERVIYSFCSQSNCVDGGAPFAGVTVDGAGNIFGGATLGGVASNDSCCGVLYELKKHGTNWDYSALHMFCSNTVNDVCLDGRYLMAPPTIDAAGSLYGTTTYGGTNDNGTVFKFEQHGAKLTTLYNFCQKTNCLDGANPFAATLAMDADGTLYGTTLQGGSGGGGTVFSLSGTKLNKLSTLGTFNESTGGATIGGVVLDPSGALLGTAALGGKHSGGTLFQVTP